MALLRRRDRFARANSPITAGVRSSCKKIAEALGRGIGMHTIGTPIFEEKVCFLLLAVCYQTARPVFGLDGLSSFWVVLVSSDDTRSPLRPSSLKLRNRSPVWAGLGF